MKVKTTCAFCGYLCALEVTVKDGDVVAIQPDPTRYPYDEKIIKRCRRWRFNLDVLHSDERINYPLKRVGQRGSGNFERISWDQAISEIAERFSTAVATYGPQTIASSIGGPHTIFWPIHRFMNLLGSPNNMGIGQICWNVNVLMNIITCGGAIESNILPGYTGCTLLWGTNPAESDNSLFWSMILSLKRTDTSLVVVDPRRTSAAKQADVHLELMPGTDVTLALGIIRELFVRGAVDQEFLDTWCLGVDELKEHVEPYTPSYIEQICKIPTKTFHKAVDHISKSPLAIHTGRGIDQLAQDTEAIHRSLAILRAITGSLDVVGGNHICEPPEYLNEYKLEASGIAKESANTKHLNTQYTPLQSPKGYAAIREATGYRGEKLPKRYLTSAHPDLVWDAMIHGDPYPITGLIVLGADPVMTYADTNKVLEAFENLETVVVIEQYMTPTAQLADYVLPVAGALESTRLHAQGGVANLVYGGPPAIKPLYERKDDYSIIRSLALAMGQSQELWPHETIEEALAEEFEQGGASWEHFVTYGIIEGEKYFNKHLWEYDDGTPQGFATNSGKVELASSLLEAHGGDRLPTPLKRPHALSDELILITGARIQPYYASSYFENPSFRDVHPAPTATLSEKTAEKLGIKSGEAVLVTTDAGEARFEANIAPMAENTVSVEYGWWYPEESKGLPSLSGAFVSNPNMMITAPIEKFKGSVGSWSYNALTCRIRKCE